MFNQEQSWLWEDLRAARSASVEVIKKMELGCPEWG